MSNRKRRRVSRERMRRQKQVLRQRLILLAVAAAVFFFILNRVTRDRDQENTVSAGTEISAAAETGVPESAGSSAGDSVQPAEAGQTDDSENPNSSSSETAEEPDAAASSSETTEEPDAAAASSETDDAASSETEEDGTTPVVTAAPEEDWLQKASEEETELPQEVAALNKTVEEAKERQALLNLNDEELATALREREVPEELIEFMQEYPETREFVVGYLFQPSTKLSMDISGEVTKGVIPHFLQWDPRWGYEMYGGSMMAVSACGPTAMSEVYSGLTGKTDMNPYEMAQWAENKGYHIMGSGTAWDMMASGASLLGLNVWTIASTESAILETLRDGYPIIAAMAPGDFTYFGHFIVLVSADANGNISIRDSNSNIRTQRTWTADELLWQINQMWAYSYEMFPE